MTINADAAQAWDTRRSPHDRAAVVRRDAARCPRPVDTLPARGCVR